MIIISVEQFLEVCFLELACNVAKHADLAAVVLQEGLSNICLITPSMTTVRAKIDVTIPRKRRGHAAQHEKVRGFFLFCLFASGILKLRSVVGDA